MPQVLRSIAWLAVALAFLWPATGSTQAGAFEIKPVAETTVTALPDGPLFWRIRSFPTLVQAQAAAREGDLAAQAWGRAWLFSLGPYEVTPASGTIAQIGPLPQLDAAEYLLRVNLASGPPGSMSNVHSNPGSEAQYVLEGEETIQTPRDITKVRAGQVNTGPGADTPMQVSSTGATDLRAIALFVVDANRPFSAPAEFSAR